MGSRRNLAYVRLSASMVDVAQVHGIRPMMRCDGCDMTVKRGDILCVSVQGHEAHYCGDCHHEYEGWVAACAMEEARLNRMLDFFIEQSRQKITLLFIPQDLPPVRLGSGATLRLS